MVGVGEQAQGVVEEGTASGVVVGVVGELLVEGGVELSSRSLVVGFADGDGGVGVFGEVLGKLDGDSTPGAGGLRRGPAGAHDVGVDVAVPVLRVGDDEPGAALSAVDRAFEVVAVHLGCFDGALVCGQHRLDLIPDLGRNDCRVIAFVTGASIDHIALVVRVRQEPVNRRNCERLGWASGGSAAPAR